MNKRQTQRSEGRTHLLRAIHRGSSPPAVRAGTLYVSLDYVRMERGIDRRWSRLYNLAVDQVTPQFESEKALTQESRRAIKAIFAVGVREDCDVVGVERDLRAAGSVAFRLRCSKRGVEEPDSGGSEQSREGARDDVERVSRPAVLAAS